MPRFLRWLGITAGVLAALLVIAVGAVYALSGRQLGRKYRVHGVREDSTSLIVMPSETFAHMSDRDLGIA